MKNILQTINLTKKYGPYTAVENLSLAVQQGEIYGFLGLNGAGKTTTIRILLGMIKPTSGDVFWFGKSLRDKTFASWDRLGFMVETPGAYSNLTVIENLEIVAKLRGVRSKTLINDVVVRLRLDPYRNKKAGQLSLGNAQRLGLAKAIFHRPEVLILDEPTNGLDPAGIIEVRNLLKEMAENDGVTIFVSSHILGEISRLVTRFGIIHKGRLQIELNAGQLAKLTSKVLRVSTSDARALQLLRSQGFEGIATADPLELIIEDEKALKHPEMIARILVNAGYDVKHLMIEREDLEHFFVRTINAIDHE
ncbi:MAG: ABC transporter ATP-binding protein [Saprospiraceae bacterium]|nr:ABC transporter ATP-binding protein [Saprospiraceae bacterium]